MNLIFTILFAFLIGYLVRQRLSGVTVYLACVAFLFSFQSLGLLLEFLSHTGDAAFGDYPASFPIEYSMSSYLGYGAVNLIITLAGVGLVLLGHVVRSRRVAKRDSRAVN